jgi:hypothetical protein
MEIEYCVDNRQTLAAYLGNIRAAVLQLKMQVRTGLDVSLAVRQFGGYYSRMTVRAEQD